MQRQLTTFTFRESEHDGGSVRLWGTPFSCKGVYVVDYGQNAGYEAKVIKKYGGTVAWAVPTLQRLKSWGFNSLNLYADAAVIPFATDKSYPVDGHGLHSIPVKLPFVMQIRPAMYSMENPTLTINYKPQKLLPPGHEVKDMEAGWSPNFKGYRPSYGIADYFDGNMQTWLDSFLMNATPNSLLNNLVFEAFRSQVLSSR